MILPLGCGFGRKRYFRRSLVTFLPNTGISLSSIPLDTMISIAWTATLTFGDEMLNLFFWRRGRYQISWVFPKNTSTETIAGVMYSIGADEISDGYNGTRFAYRAVYDSDGNVETLMSSRH